MNRELSEVSQTKKLYNVNEELTLDNSIGRNRGGLSYRYGEIKIFIMLLELDFFGIDDIHCSNKSPSRLKHYRLDTAPPSPTKRHLKNHYAVTCFGEALIR